MSRGSWCYINSDKCIFIATFLPYLEFIIDAAEGFGPDPKKVKANQDFHQPSSPTEVQHFLGMINQLAKFVPNISEVSAPLRKLIGKKNSFLIGRRKNF